MGFDLGQLRHASGVAATVEGCGQEQLHDLFGQTQPHHPSAHGQHVGVVVGSGHTGRVQVVAQRSARTAYLVGGQLLSLTAATQHDAHLHLAITHQSGHGGADGWIIDAVGGMGTAVDHGVTLLLQQRDEMLFEVEAGVVGAQGDT